MPIAPDDVIKHVRNLPSLPAVITDLLVTMDQQDVDLGSLVKKITLDQALTAKALRLANSSFYGMPSQVTTIGQAMSILGFRSIRTLLTACSVTNAFARDAGSGFDFESFWRHSVGAAVCAQKLAKRVRINPDTAFTAALLHDIGVLVMATGFSDQYGDVRAYQRNHDCDAITAEQAVLGVDHTVVGSALTAHWKFPLEMQQAVAGHHSATQSKEAPLTLVLHAANAMAHGLDLSGVEDDLAPPLSQEVWDALALSDAQCVALFTEVEAAFEEMCQVLVNG
jgi:putative nucleotidyltransferase with HDIG domain